MIIKILAEKKKVIHLSNKNFFLYLTVFVTKQTRRNIVEILKAEGKRKRLKINR